MGLQVRADSWLLIAREKGLFMKKNFILVLILCSVLTGCAKKNTSETQNEFPSSIVALSPSAAEILFAVGAGNQVSAVCEFTDYPPEAAQKPIVGGFDGKTFSMESILSYKPDLLYITDGMHNFLIEQLNQYGIKYYLSKADSIASVKNEILDIGKITGHEKEALSVVEEMDSKINSIKIASTQKTIYYEIWNSPFMTAGSKSFLTDVIKSAGYKNIFDDVEEAYPIVSEESIIARKPEIILISSSSGLTKDSIKSRKGWETIPAVQNDNIIIIDDNLYTRPAPRIADVVVELAAR